MRILFCLFISSTVLAAEVIHVRVADTINPGTADYIVSNIEKAEQSKAPFFVLEIDTPGGLLSATRTIVQKMLNASMPVVVFVSPRGAHAGSAGALITFAADVAAMAPGTNIGAAHPVVPGAKDKEIDKTMAEKMTNDTAAFAESLAKAKGRNWKWAIKSVKQSASIVSEDALKTNVIDLIAEDLEDLKKQLAGYQLKVPKNGLKKLPDTIPSFQLIEPTIKQGLVSFFANPTIAYLILSLAGLCIWVELTHPGLIFPGVLGGICVILSLIAFQMLPIHYGALSLILLGMGLLIAEAFIPSFGVVGLLGVGCFVFGSVFLMDTNVPEFQISLSVIIPTAVSLGGFALLMGYLVLRSHRREVVSGLHTHIGDFAEVREKVSSTNGMVFIHGELWKAVTTHEGEEISPHETVVVKDVRNMVLVVQKNSDK